VLDAERLGGVMRHRNVKNVNFTTRAFRALQVLFVSACMAVFVSACGGGSADEPSSPRPVSSGASAAVATTSGGSVVAGPRPVGSTQGSSSTTAGTTAPDFTVNACSLGYLNGTRFLGSGLEAVGIDDAIECGFCPSAETCTTPEGICKCIVVAADTGSSPSG